MIRIDPKKDCRGKLPDHLVLPKFSDTFVAGQNPSLVRELASGNRKFRCTLNDLKWQVGLRGSIEEVEKARRIRLKK